MSLLKQISVFSSLIMLVGCSNLDINKRTEYFKKSSMECISEKLSIAIFGTENMKDMVKVTVNMMTDNSNKKSVLIKEELKTRDADIQLQLAKLYMQDQEYKKAFLWLQESAQQGYIPAQVSLAHAYYHGYGTTRDYYQAFKLYTKTAQQGNPEAQYNLGQMYLLGKGTQKSQRKGLYWINKSSQAGSMVARAYLKKLINKK